ncbi:recombinase family protein [Streptomyces sp. BE20]|uniref:recombinase family protein n=1 Tax=Streptomyces sp. BE20 TaxID=3002525 RepID=UPI002E7725DE|nr:recombinase family protein [Streptomyces sp. BE20]MEE1825671.1 recombinase family protein [Streptomyces sp. BE20]
MNWAGLTRLSTEEVEGELPGSEEPGKIPYLTGRDIKSTDEHERDDREYVERRGGKYVWTYREPDTSAWKRRRVKLPDGTYIHRVIRPVLDNALENLRARRAPNGERLDGLIVVDLDRLTRDPRRLEDCIDVVERYGIPIIDISGSLDLLTDKRPHGLPRPTGSQRRRPPGRRRRSRLPRPAPLHPREQRHPRPLHRTPAHGRSHRHTAPACPIPTSVLPSTSRRTPHRSPPGA